MYDGSGKNLFKALILLNGQATFLVFALEKKIKMQK